jgi:hypothetical protein
LIYGRAIIKSIDGTKAKLLELGAKLKAHFAFKDIIYQSVQGKCLTDDTLKNK